MIASTQITNIETFAVIAVSVFELLSHKFLFINIKTIETVEKLRFKKTANFTGKLLQNYK